MVTWGDADSSAVQDQLKTVLRIEASHQLKNVRQIEASHHAFAAILGDGSVVSWGRPPLGGGIH